MLLILTETVFATDPLKWKAHDLNRQNPKVIIPPKQYLPIEPPSDGIILFDSNDLSKWESMNGEETEWICNDDYFECVKGSGYIKTKQHFGDIQLHIEWAAPLPVKGSSQGRGNSGVFLMGRYEVQVLDSYDNITYADGQAGAIYGQYPPDVNVARAPGQWQSYDIIFRRPHFMEDGKLMKPAIITVFHNGVLIHDHVELWGGTDWLKYRSYEAHPDKMPLSLQDHGNPVRYRNVWVRELEKPEEPSPNYPASISLPVKLLENYTGQYWDMDETTIDIYLEKDHLKMKRNDGQELVLVCHSEDKFSIQSTAIDLIFSFNKDGLPTGLEYHFTGYITKMKKIK
ncbi:family 16 glycoside hydrolase [bacterium]